MPGVFPGPSGGGAGPYPGGRRAHRQNPAPGEGDRVFAFDGLGNRLECEIVRADRREVDLRVLSAVPAGTEPRVSVTLYQGLRKRPGWSW